MGSTVAHAAGGQVNHAAADLRCNRFSTTGWIKGHQSMSESFAQMFEQSLAAQRMRPGAIVNATVVEVRPDVVIVNAGLKSEGIVPIAQFWSK